MKIEIEIKLRLPDEVTEIRRKLRACGFHIAKRRVLESNILFDNFRRTLRKHGKLIRVRRVATQVVMTYKGPGEQGKYKKREEDELTVSDGEAIERILAHIGYHPVFRYEKFRTEYVKRAEAGMVLLDETPIGNFLELEGGMRWIDRTAKLLGFSTADYINRSYGYLYWAYCRERRIRPADMLFENRRPEK